jgi:hypothetical protein
VPALTFGALRRYAASMRAAIAAAFLLPLLSGCSVWFFSGESWIDRSRPVVLVETTGGIEFGAATELGVLTLGRSAATGPCRVHYFLGPTPLIEGGELVPAGDVFTRADIELKTQQVRVLDRSPGPDDELVAMWTPDGTTTRAVRVSLARAAGLAGDVLQVPSEALPAGAALFCRGNDDSLLFTGLVAGTATIGAGPAAGRYYVFAGVDRVRELLAVPTPHPVDRVPKYRTDDIMIEKVRPQPPPLPSEPPK